MLLENERTMHLSTINSATTCCGHEWISLGKLACLHFISAFNIHCTHLQIPHHNYLLLCFPCFSRSLYFSFYSISFSKTGHYVFTLLKVLYSSLLGFGFWVLACNRDLCTHCHTLNFEVLSISLFQPFLLKNFLPQQN